MPRTIFFAFLWTCLTISACKHEIDIAGIPHPDDTPLPIPCPDSLEDIDGNVYQVIDVGGTCWTTRNLCVSKFNNGDDIPLVTEGQDWIQLNTPAQCYYDNDSVNLDVYGRLYNGYAVVDSRGLCPVGWKVPHDSDWVNLADFLGGESVAGDKLKTLDLWFGPGTPATNEIGFSAKPGGARILQGNGAYNSISNMGYWWSSQENGAEVLINRQITYANSNLAQASNSKKLGLSVRCIRK
jgi:uncharacterized protein (TIGR02145 family)